jgi:aryl-alcohol dehydrogenase-like predicted oxidoreductase
MELRGPPAGPDVPDERAGRLLNAVLDGGIDLIDTSVDYGRSEELIGRFVAHRRREFFLATKCGCPLVPPGNGARPPYPHDYRPANIRAGIDQSLRRLRTDVIDLIQVHLSPGRDQLEEDDVVATLQSARDQGKVRFIGMSGTLPHLPDHIAMGVFDAFQIPYSALQREHEELVGRAAAAGAATIIRGGVARGVGPDGPAGRGPIGLDPGEGRRRWDDARLADLLDGSDATTFLLRFTLSHPDLHTTIVGTADLGHLAANLGAADLGPLPADVYREAKDRLTAAGSCPIGEP